MRRSYVVGLIAAAVLAETACSLLTPLDGYSGTVIVIAADAGADSGDAAPDALLDGGMETSSVADAGDDAGANIHPEGTFEGTACTGWEGYEAMLDKTGVARSGSGACRVCANQANSFFTADDKGQAGAAIVGATYYAEGWVRTAPNRPTPGPSALYLRSFSNIGGNNFMTLEQESSTPTQLDDVWKRFEAQLTVTKPDGLINVYVGAANVPNACFVIDDIVLRRVK